MKQNLQNQKQLVSLRVYADTYEECVGLFNSLVNEKVEWFLQRAEETKKDLIEKKVISQNAQNRL